MPILKNKQERTFTFWIGSTVPEGGTIPEGSVVTVIAGSEEPVSEEKMEKLRKIPMFLEALRDEHIVIVGQAQAESMDAKDREIAELKERLRQAAIAKKAARDEAKAEAMAEAKAAKADEAQKAAEAEAEAKAKAEAKAEEANTKGKGRK
jgi:pyruvate/2-oxoglutarate dehydrogenase complex dihydrolipoamide acyltransferase (E2) component